IDSQAGPFVPKSSQMFPFTPKRFPNVSITASNAFADKHAAFSRAIIEIARRQFIHAKRTGRRLWPIPTAWPFAQKNIHPNAGFLAAFFSRPTRSVLGSYSHRTCIVVGS